MFKTVGEIQSAVTAFRQSTNYRKLRQRWEDDFNLYRLAPYNAGKGYYSYTSNSARIIADKAISLLTSANLLIRVPEEVLNEQDRIISGNAERFVYGSLNYNDEKALYQPDQRNLRQLKAWFATIRGGWAERVYVHKNEEGQTCPEIRVWDIYNVCYDADAKGITWAANFYRMSASHAKDEYNAVVSSSYVDCIDYWDREKNIVIVDGKQVYENKHGLGYCPVFIFRVGATPQVWQANYTYTDSHVGESIYAPIRNILPLLNKTLSDLLTIVRRGVKTPMGYWSSDGSKNIEQDIYQVEKVAVVPFKIGEVFAPLMTPSMPQNGQDLVNIVVGEIQRGSFPHTTYGEVATRLSGYAINQLNAALSTVIEPFIAALEHSYIIDALELIKQFTGSSFPAIKIRGRNSYDRAFGYAKADELKPSDIKGDWHPEARLELVLPKDDPQKVEMARFLREGEIPLLSDQTIRSEVLGVQDVDLEAALVDREWADKLAINRLYDAYVQFVADGNQMKATNVLAALKQLMVGQGVSSAKPNQAGAGFTAKTMPPETLGSTPPGAKNAIMPTQPGVG